MAEIRCADIAARIHADMCEDDRNGYSQSPRWGGDHPDGKKRLTIDGREYEYRLGSYDCSSSVITAWSQALRYTPYEGSLDGATVTGDMRPVFEGSGLFTSSREYAKRGDIYLNDVHHTAMCQDGGGDGVYGYDCMSEFAINENGGVTGGRVGDQTGGEARITAFRQYSRGWDPTLHYNGKADVEGGGRADEGAGNSYVRRLQRELNAQCGAGIAEDGEWGPNTRAAASKANAILRNGDSGNMTRILQEVLNAHGFRLGIDAEFGPNTEKAVRDFQRVSRFSEADIDGEVGGQTWEALFR